MTVTHHDGSSADIHGCHVFTRRLFIDVEVIIGVTYSHELLYVDVELMYFINRKIIFCGCGIETIIYFFSSVDYLVYDWNA